MTITVRKTHIKREVKYTAKKITVKYMNTVGDQILKVVERSDPMTPEQQAHFDAWTDSIINDAEEQSDNDERQDELFVEEDPDDSGELEDGEEVELQEADVTAEEPLPEPPPPEEPTSEEPEPAEPEEAPEESPAPKGPVAPAAVFPVPAEEVKGQEPDPEAPVVTDWESEPLPVFENSEMPEFKKMEKDHLIWYINNSGKEVICEDMNWNFKVSLSPSMTLEKLRKEALHYAFQELKIK